VGFVTGLAGWAFYVAALHFAPLSLVQSVSAGGLAVLALLVALTPGGGGLGRRDSIAVVVSIVGLVFLGWSLAGHPATGSVPSAAAVAEWLVALALAAGAATGAVRIGLPAAAGLGIAAGTLYAAGDIATKAAVGSAGLAPFVPAIFAFHGLAFVCLQFGFQRGGALVTIGLSTLFTNALPIAAGMSLFHEHLPPGGLGDLRLVGFALVTAGAVLLARGGREYEQPADALGRLGVPEAP
jgi:hypothetical protein